MPEKDSAEKAIRDIRRKTRRKFSSEEKIRIVLEGLRGVAEKPPIQTFPFDSGLWFSKAVSKISPRLGSTPGDWRGLQGTRSTVKCGLESKSCEKSRAPSAG